MREAAAASGHREYAFSRAAHAAFMTELLPTRIRCSGVSIAFQLTVVFVGSFALGWHYLLDGVIGTAGALGCWFIATRILSNSIVEPEPGTLATIG